MRLKRQTRLINISATACESWVAIRSDVCCFYAGISWEMVEGKREKKRKKRRKKKEKRKIEIPAEQWKEYTVGIQRVCAIVCTCRLYRISSHNVVNNGSGFQEYAFAFYEREASYYFQAVRLNRASLFLRRFVSPSSMGNTFTWNLFSLRSTVS